MSDKKVYSGGSIVIFESNGGRRYVEYDGEDGRCLTLENGEDLLVALLAEILLLSAELAVAEERAQRLSDMLDFAQDWADEAENRASRARAEGRLEGMRELAGAAKEHWPNTKAMVKRMDHKIAAALRDREGGEG